MDALLVAGDDSALRAAALCTQLPRGSRVMVAYDPSQAWTPTDYLLREVEWELRCLMWDGGGEGPVRIEAPGDAERAEREAAAESSAMAAVAAAIPGI